MKYYVSNRQMSIYLWSAGAVGFILGTSVGAFIYMAIVHSQFKEMLGR